MQMKAFGQSFDLVIEATFHISGKLNQHNVGIYCTEDPHGTRKLTRDIRKVTRGVDKTSTANIYLDVLKNALCHS